MPSVASVKKDLEALRTTGQEEILNYLEEVIILGSFTTEVTKLCCIIKYRHNVSIVLIKHNQ